VIAALGLAWGLLVAVPAAARARRVGAAARTRSLAPERNRRANGRVRARLHALGEWPLIATVRRVLGAPRRIRAERRLSDRLAREVAVAVDLVAVGVAAGCTPYLAVELGAQWSPPLVGAALAGAMRATSVGQSFDDALRELGASAPALRGLTDTLRTSVRLGAPVAPALARLAAEVRADLRRRAETRARTLPVRLCFPLVACILPAFALLTVVPTVLAGLHT
jgi:Flp pilus assembly protein TadB